MAFDRAGSGTMLNSIMYRRIGAWVTVAFVVCFAGAAGWTYRVSVDERDRIVESGYQLSATLAAGIEAHLDEVLRDARNAVTSATLLLERSPGKARWRPDWLHRELNRELSDHASIARMMVADPEGRILASSAESRLPPGAALPPEVLDWHRHHPESADLHLGVTRRSGVSGQFVIPYSQAIFAADRRVEGYVVAELDIAHFQRLYERMLKGIPAAVRWVDLDGTRLMVFPFVESALAARINSDFPRELLRPPGGRFEIKSVLTGRTYNYAVVPGQVVPLAVGVGQDKGLLLAPWEARARDRAALVAGAALLLLGGGVVLRRNLERIARSEEKAEESAAKLRTLGDNLPDAVLYQVMRDSRGVVRFLYVSASVQWVNGLLPEEVLGDWRRLYNQVVPEDRDAVARARDVSFATKEPFNVVARVRRTDGRVRWMRFSSMPRSGAEGSVVWDGVELDITDRVEAEEEVRRLNLSLEKRVEERTQALVAANRNLEAFAYSVAHDMRAPLHRIAGFAGLLREQAAGLDPSAVRKLEVINREVLRMGELIDGLLMLARTSQADFHPARVDLGVLARDAVDDLRELHSGRDIRWTIEDLPEAYGDAVLLRQVFANLLGNAVKFTRHAQAAEIKVGAHQRPGTEAEVVVYVKDNGAGFDMQYADRLFGMFQRLHGESEFEGNGIGLALVQRIVERHGGRIWAVAEPDKGAMFNFSLPAWTPALK